MYTHTLQHYTQHNIRITTDNIKHEKTKAHLTLVLFAYMNTIIIQK